MIASQRRYRASYSDVICGGFEASGFACRRPSTAPSRPPRSSCRRPAEPERWPDGPRAARHPQPHQQADADDLGGLRLDEPEPDTLRAIGGSRSDRFNAAIVNSMAMTGWFPPNQSEEDRARQLFVAVTGMRAFKAADEIEGMIAAQAMAAHHASMECNSRAMFPEQPFEVAQGFRKAAANASRNFIELLAALDRKRGKGQVVRVERVVVHEGCQAIVGNVQGAVPATADTRAAPPLAIGHEAPGITLGDLISTQREPVKAPLSGEGGGA